MTGAALDLARSIVRRAERRAVQLVDEGGLPDSQVVPYLNRLADLLFVMPERPMGASAPSGAASRIATAHQPASRRAVPRQTGSGVAR